MNYYCVWVRSNRYHGKEPLTYACSTQAGCRHIVHVELQKELVLGIVSGPTSRAAFQDQTHCRVFDLPPLPAHLLKLASWLQNYYPAPLRHHYPAIIAS